MRNVSTFLVHHRNGERFYRTEMGDCEVALKTLFGIFGVENLKKVVFIDYAYDEKREVFVA